MKRLLSVVVLLLAVAAIAPAAMATNNLTVAISPAGDGSVSSSPTGITCPSDCTQAFSNGTSVTLTATPTSGFIFSKWTLTSGTSPGGTCTNNSTTNPCSYTAASNTGTLTAVFIALTPDTITAVGVGAQSPSPVIAGSSATYTITTTWAGNETCTSNALAINWTAPAGATASFSPTAVTNGATTSTLTITTTGGTTPAGTTTFTVKGATTASGGCGTSSITSGSASLVVSLGTATLLSAGIGGQSPSPVPQGSSASYAITSSWSGTGLSCASIPLFVNWTGTQPAGTTVGFSPASVSSGATTSTLTITTDPLLTPPGSTMFNVEIATNVGNGCAANGAVLTPTATLVVSGNSAPVIAKSFSPTTIAQGGTSTLTLTITNPAGNTAAMTGLAVSDTLPTGMLTTASPTVTNTCGGTFSAPGNSSTASLTGGGSPTALAVGASCTLSVTVTVASAGSGSFANTTGAVSATNGGTGNTASATLAVYGTATKIVFTAQPTSAVAGATITPAVAVTVEDANSNVVLNSSAPVTMGFGTNAGGGTLTGGGAQTPTNGVATFSGLSINKTGTGYTLSASDGTLTSAASSTFNITPGTASQLAFTTEPSASANGGGAFTQQPVVSVEDANGNLVSTGAGSTDSIALAIGTNPSSGTLTCTNNTVTAAGGQATFAGCSINAAGAGYTLTATTAGLPVTTSTAITVNVGGATKLVYGTQPSSAVAGVAISPAVTVQVEDAGGNVVTTSTAPVAIAITTNPGSGTLSGTTPVNAVAGVATFSNLSINKVGTGYILSATSNTLATAASNTFNITLGPATQLIFTTEPSGTATGGTAFAQQPVVKVEDANGNVETTGTDSTDLITLAIGNNPSGGTLACTSANPLPAVAGVATFVGCNINLVGTGYTLTATTGSLTMATSTGINITPGAATKLVFGTQPSNTQDAASITPAVTVQITDAGGNLTSSTATVAIAIGTNPGGGTLSGTLSHAAVAGTATFTGLSINKIGTGYTLSATSSGLTTGTSATFNITAGPATQLGFSVQPSNTAHGASITPAVVVQIQDAGGNLVSSASASITVAIGTNPAGGTLTGTLTQPTSGGAATFSNLSINNIGTAYTLTASSSPVFTAATSSNFNITVAAPSQVVFTTEPSASAAPATAFAAQPVVKIEDASGNVITSGTDSNASVTLAIGTNPGGGTLTCTTNPVTATAGVAGFAGCKINNAGNGYTLTATVSGLPVATSTTINIFTAPAITSANSATFSLNVAGSFTVTATGSPAPTFSETGGLPNGVTLSSAGVLSGTPTTFGTFPIVIDATNSNPPDATQNFTLTVLPIASDTVNFGPGTASTSTTLSWTHTVGSGTNRVLLVSVAMRNDSGSGGNGPGIHVTGITWGSSNQALTCLSVGNDEGTAVTCPSSAGTGNNFIRGELWYLLNPNSQTNGTITVTVSAATVLTGESASYTGVASIVTGGVAFSNVSSSFPSSTPGLTVTNSGGIVVDALIAARSANSLTPGSSQAKLVNGATSESADVVTTGSGLSGHIREAMSQSIVTNPIMTWTFGAASPFVQVAAILNPVAATSRHKGQVVIGDLLNYEMLQNEHPSEPFLLAGKLATIE